MQARPGADIIRAKDDNEVTDTLQITKITKIELRKADN